MRRGFHAHHQLNQCLIAINGSCKVLMDYGMGNKHIFNLNNRSQGLLINKMVWHEMYDFSDNCILLALADDYFTESDYIRDYEEFVKLVKN
jgi:dTDP-4-dehydrorhamnose 3,5-epimerase-like enzyme